MTDIEDKWSKRWKEANITKFDEQNLANKYYLLEMFSYPSGAKLHLGHWYNFGLADSFGIFKKMQGYNLFHPMGFDSFGLPAENYAIKTGVHPKDSTETNIATMKEQLSKIGGTHTWDYLIETHTPEYYKWTQWLFLQLFKHGYAYQKHAPVNWCNGCNTVLANEQVNQGLCERCGSQVVKKDLTQWFFRITDFCEELLEGLDRIDYPEKTKTAQRNWIGKSVGSTVDFDSEEGTISVFTSRVDTLAGVTFMCIAPEHPMAKKLTKKEQEEAVADYIYETSKKDEITRTSTTSEKTGVFTGSYCKNPLTGESVPIFIADYVLASYGTGAVMGVGAHDTRDFDFAEKFNLEIRQVIAPKDKSCITLPFIDEGILVNSGAYNGLDCADARLAITNDLHKLNRGDFKTNYKLRDWSVSRQRYWGCPIPIIHCEHCGIVPVPEEDLPVELPPMTDFKPDGRSPLSKIDSYMNVKCPICGRDARRDPDTLDTYVCSSWYELRYPNANNKEVAFDKEWTNKILPVDTYVGGMEHATGHLIYYRFITKFLHKFGYLNFDEPVKRLIHQGMILSSDGQKMSKSKGNTVSADEIVSEYGADVLRMYLMFGFNYTDGGPWSQEGLASIQKFMGRVERVVAKVYEDTNGHSEYREAEKELDYVRNYTIKQTTSDYENFSFNTVIARIMELVNALSKYTNQSFNSQFAREVVIDLVKILAPSCPHFAEELWSRIGQPFSILNAQYPICNETKLVKQSVEIVIQINSKIIDRMVIDLDSDEKIVVSNAQKGQKVISALNTKTIIKTIYVKNKVLNFIIK